MLESPVPLTNSAGVHADPMAETVLGMILHFARGLDLATGSQRSARWDPSAFYRGDAPIVELARSTVGVVGLGGVGRAVGARVAALGARVLGLRRKESGAGEVPLHAPSPDGGAGARSSARAA